MVGTLRVVRWAALAAFALFSALLFAAVLLAWRLAAGPVDVTDSVRTLARSHLPVPVAIGQATLAWNGWHDPAAPLVLSLRRLSAPGPGNAPDRLDRAEAEFAPSDLLRLEVAPRLVAVSGGQIELERRADGTVAWRQGPPPPGRDAGPLAVPQGQLSLRAVTLRLSDPSGRQATLAIDRADLSHRAGMPPTGTLRAILASAGARVAVDASLARAGAAASDLTLSAGPLVPASLAPLLPALAALGTPATLAGHVALDDRLRPRKVALRLTLGAGLVTVAGGNVPLGGGTLDLDATPGPGGHASLAGQLDLRDAAGATGPVLSVDGALDGDPLGPILAGRLDARLTPFPLAAAGTWWPPDLARGGRQWVVQNLTAGTVANATVRARLASTTGIAGLRVASVTGGLDGTGVTLHWLRPIAPITDAHAHLQIDNEDQLSIDLASGRQGALDVSGSRMVIGGLTARDQPGTIDAHIKGPLASILAILGEKRLHLLSRQPIPLVDPSGDLDGRLHVALPLDDRVTMDQVAINADVALAHVHLGQIAFGHSIDDGAFRLTADTDGLTMRGDARFAQLPTTLAVGLDFRAGPPSEVTERVEASSIADAAALRRFSPAAAGLLGGSVALSADYKLRRDERATATLDADFLRASVRTPFGWGKDAGAPGTLHAVVTLVRDRLASVDALDAHGPDLIIESHGIEGRGGLSGLALDRLRVGRTRAAGRLDFPGGSGQPFRMRLAGPELDLAELFAHGPPAKPAPPSRTSTGRTAAEPTPSAASAPRQPWSASLDFTRVTLARHVDAGGVRARLAGDGPHLARAEVSATGPVAATGSLEPAQGGHRRLSVRTTDAGGLLSAFDLTDRIRGGTLQVDATLTNGGPANGIDGTVRLDRFTLLRVPAVVRLLRDLTVYGFLDRAPSPDISVTRVVSPFDWRAGLLTVREARAWQPALGLTAKGTLDTAGNVLDVTGTIVPVYALNTLPGRIPLIGRLFSPERGGGLFAATYSLRGAAGSPTVKINPLAALLPGVLRELTSP